MWMAGGGIKGGTIYGETDDFSYNIVKDPVHIRDFHATVLHLLGFDHERFTYQLPGARPAADRRRAGGGDSRFDGMIEGVGRISNPSYLVLRAGRFSGRSLTRRPRILILNCLYLDDGVMEQIDSPLPSNQFDSLMLRAAPATATRWAGSWKAAGIFSASWPIAGWASICVRRSAVPIWCRKPSLTFRRISNSFKGAVRRNCMPGWNASCSTTSLIQPASIVKPRSATGSRSFHRLRFGAAEHSRRRFDTEPQGDRAQKARGTVRSHQALPEDYRRVILLRNQEKHTFEEVAAHS